MGITLDTKIVVLIVVYAIFNLGIFIYMGWDKVKAINKRKRVPEALFLFLSICFCALGVWLGMIFFRHKTKKIYFSLGVPLAFLENLSFGYIIYLLV